MKQQPSAKQRVKTYKQSSLCERVKGESRPRKGTSHREIENQMAQAGRRLKANQKQPARHCEK